MKSYSTFIFDSYDFDPGEGAIRLRYSLDDEIQFIETLTLPSSKEWPRPATYNAEELKRALFALHLIAGISYYKTCIPKTMEIRSGSLTKVEAAFWNAVYENGLGEFFYKNDIDFRGLIHFPVEQTPPPSLSRVMGEGRRKVLVPIGGGKDSLVTVELLKKAGYDCVLYRGGEHPVITEAARIAGLPLLNVKRSLSGKLFDLNAEGALNGHVPATAYLSVLTTVLAILYGFDAVVLSNERSANVGNLHFHGKEINHQWSKSLEFERMYQEYVRTSITPNVQIFSLLKPLSELHIASLFARQPQYFSCATSCNENWKLQERTVSNLKPGQLWCGQCPKCAFVFALYAAFLPRATLEKIFGSIFFDHESLQKFYRELLDIEGYKPFECVGTPEETSAAFLLAHRRGDLEDTQAMKVFVEHVLPTIKKPDALIDTALTLSDEHAIPAEFLKTLPHTS